MKRELDYEHQTILTESGEGPVNNLSKQASVQALYFRRKFRVLGKYYLMMPVSRSALNTRMYMQKILNEYVVPIAPFIGRDFLLMLENPHVCGYCSVL